MKAGNVIRHFNFRWLIAILVISVTWVNLNHERWLSKNVIHHDIISYYAYLPALFIHHDLSLKFIDDSTHQKQDERFWPNRAPNGNYVIKMSMGMAIGYLPFFALAHVYAKLSGYSDNGFSEPYHFAILFSSLFYFVIGLFYLRRVLKLFFPENIVLLTLFCLCFATNVFFYLTLGGGLAHIFGFTLVAMFIYYTLKWKETPLLKYSLFLGLILGLLVLVRPVNVLVATLFAGLVLFPYNELTVSKFKLFFVHSCFVALTGLLVFLPQLLYWKLITGEYFFNSYVGEGFFFKNPHVIKALFGFRKGWLIYTPVMTFALIGIAFLKNKLRLFLLPTIVLFLIYVYVCFSWWCWWYGGSFGQRVLIDIYPLMALPFAAFLLYVQNTKLFFKKIIYCLIVFFTFLNLFQTMQCKYNILHFDSMTAANYRQIFLTTSKKPDREKYLKHPDYEKALRGEDEE